MLDKFFLNVVLKGKVAWPPRSEVRMQHIFNSFFKGSFHRRFFFKRSLKIVNTYEKSVLGLILKSDCPSMHLVGVVAIFNDLGRGENRVLNKWNYQKKFCQISAMITSFYWGTHRHLSSLRGIFWQLKTPDFMKVWKCYHIKKHPVLQELKRWVNLPIPPQPVYMPHAPQDRVLIGTTNWGIDISMMDIPSVSVLFHSKS